MKFSFSTSVLALATSAAAASLEQVTEFGENASGTRMYIYVPDTLPSNAPVIVAIHWCTGTAEAYYTGSPYAELADKHGFIVVYPESPYEGGCWDVSSKSALTHNGGGDSNSIANMVSYTLDKYDADAKRVFVTGTSSGAMMTNVMAATYPELFKAATAYSGVPAGCFMSAADEVAAWNNTCSQGEINESAAYWAATARAMYPAYNGSYPRFQVYHGSVDEGLLPQNFNETVKQWTGVFGLDASLPEQTLEEFPEANYTTTVFGITKKNPLGTVRAIWAEGVGHTVPIHGDEDMEWFGLSQKSNVTMHRRP